MNATIQAIEVQAEMAHNVGREVPDQPWVDTLLGVARNPHYRGEPVACPVTGIHTNVDINQDIPF